MGGTNKQGIGQLFPYNAFINAEDYFRRRFCGSSFETSFENFFLLGYNAVSILALALALRSVRNSYAKRDDCCLFMYRILQVALEALSIGRDLLEWGRNSPRNACTLSPVVDRFGEPVMPVPALRYCKGELRARHAYCSSVQMYQLPDHAYCTAFSSECIL